MHQPTCCSFKSRPRLVFSNHGVFSCTFTWYMTCFCTINYCMHQNLQVVPLSTISAICPKVMHGHQHVMQPIEKETLKNTCWNCLYKIVIVDIVRSLQLETSSPQSQRPVDHFPSSIGCGGTPVAYCAIGGWPYAACGGWPYDGGVNGGCPMEGYMIV